MIHILLLGKYVKPLIELIDLDTESITIIKDGGYLNDSTYDSDRR